MKTNYILIDFENVQPKCLSILKGHPFKVLLFVGANQSKISLELAADMQALGTNAEYIQITGNGRNALDFHIAYYAGQISERDPDCYLHIVSKDTGFDPLIKHMKSRNVPASRIKSLADVPILKVANAKSLDEKVDAIVQNLNSRGTSRPRKVKTLASTINSIFLKSLNGEEPLRLVEELKKRGYVAIDQQNVSYLPPISQA